MPKKNKAVSWWRRPLCFQQFLSQEKASLSSLSLSLSPFLGYRERLAKNRCGYRYPCIPKKQNISLQTSRTMSVNCFAHSHWWETGMWVTLIVEMMPFFREECDFFILQKMFLLFLVLKCLFRAWLLTRVFLFPAHFYGWGCFFRDTKCSKQQQILIQWRR